MKDHERKNKNKKDWNIFGVKHFVYAHKCIAWVRITWVVTYLKKNNITSFMILHAKRPYKTDESYK